MKNQKVLTNLKNKNFNKGITKLIERMTFLSQFSDSNYICSYIAKVIGSAIIGRRDIEKRLKIYQEQNINIDILEILSDR